jgi:hypothetical protein
LALVEAEVDEMASNLRSQEGASSSSGGGGLMTTLGLNLFQEKRYLRPLLVGMSLMLFQQVGPESRFSGNWYAFQYNRNAQGGKQTCGA